MPWEYHYCLWRMDSATLDLYITFPPAACYAAGTKFILRDDIWLQLRILFGGGTMIIKLETLFWSITGIRLLRHQLTRTILCMLLRCGSTPLAADCFVYIGSYINAAVSGDFRMLSIALSELNIVGGSDGRVGNTGTRRTPRAWSAFQRDGWGTFSQLKNKHKHKA